MWRKQNRKFSLYFRIMGLVMLIVGIGLIADGIGNYVDQSRQKGWITTAATVTDASSQVVRYPTKGRSRTYYTIVYEYEANGEIYTGSIGHLLSPRLVGDTITVKYDPEMPEENTTILSPNTRDLLTLLILGTAIAVVGFFLSGGLELFRNLLRKKHTEEPKESVPKTDTGFDSTAIAKIPAKQWVPRLAAWLLAFVAVVLFVKFFLTSNIASPDEFRNAAVSAGYAAADSTEDLRESWGVGSLLSRSVSVYESSLRLDLCKMDSADSCRRLYAGMTLPITGEVTESNTLSRQVYAVDTPTNFSAKICIGQMLLYVFTTQEDKADVLAFLESVGYWGK
ncbi:MAG: hypothetical protein BHV90_12620 [Clostridiales bacterium 42_27]|nr:MAG: hypothetical protein BHV90_12620 [Clostridiales bacterium 42_27]